MKENAYNALTVIELREIARKFNIKKPFEKKRGELIRNIRAAEKTALKRR